MISLTSLLRIGLIAGILAALVSGVFSYVLAEPVIDRAIALEAARQQSGAAGHSQEATLAELFSRPTQHSGLLAALLLTGISFGALFAVAYWALYRKSPVVDPWARALRLAAIIWAATWLLPFIVSPASPPGVGDPETVGARTSLYLAAMVSGVLITVAAGLLNRGLLASGTPAPRRHITLAALVLAGITLTLTLPATFLPTPGPIDVPAAMLWDFRVLSVGASLLLWGVLGASFGVLAGRSAAKRGVEHHTPNIPATRTAGV